MKTLEQSVNVIYRFRCNKCKSKFEMTQEERTENDWNHTEGDKTNRSYPHNPTDKFDCPVCNSVQRMDFHSIHKFFVMDNGMEFQDY